MRLQVLVYQFQGKPEPRSHIDTKVTQRNIPVFRGEQRVFVA